jgi:sugar phosphate permease
MLMELYPGVTPSVGNLLNVLIIGGTLLGAVLVRKVYPKKLHSEVTGMLAFSSVCLPLCVVLLFAGSIHIAFVVACLCIASCFLQCGTVLVNCGNTHFGGYGKSATAAGIVNAAASVAFIFNSYGIALIADTFGWWAVLLTLLICIVLATALVLPAVPRWRKFLKSKNQE